MANELQSKEDAIPFEEAIANMTLTGTPYSKEYIFYSHMISQCRVHWDYELGGEDDPAALSISFEHDHYNLFINPNQFNKLSIGHRIGALKGEMLHILYNHPMRNSDDYEENKFHKAGDLAINQHINADHLPPGSTTIDNIPTIGGKLPENQSTEQYYEMLEDGEKDNKGNGEGSGQGQGEGTPPPGSACKWGESQGDKTIQEDITKKMMEQSLNNTQKSRGDLPSQYSDWVDIFNNSKEVNWEQLLRRIMGNKKVGSRKTLMRSDRRNPDFEWIKGRTKDRIFELLVVSDVSGSVSDTALIKLWNQVRFVCDMTQSDVNLIQVDTKALPPEKLGKNTKLIERKASGGTVLAPAIKSAAEHKLSYDAVVVTTDGYLCESDVTAYRELNKRVIWLIEADGKVMDSMNSGKMMAFQLKD